MINKLKIILDDIDTNLVYTQTGGFKNVLILDVHLVSVSQFCPYFCYHFKFHFSDNLIKSRVSKFFLYQPPHLLPFHTNTLSLFLCLSAFRIHGFTIERPVGFRFLDPPFLRPLHFGGMGVGCFHGRTKFCSATFRCRKEKNIFSFPLSFKQSLY